MHVYRACAYIAIIPLPCSKSSVYRNEMAETCGNFSRKHGMHVWMIIKSYDTMKHKSIIMHSIHVLCMNSYLAPFRLSSHRHWTWQTWQSACTDSWWRRWLLQPPPCHWTPNPGECCMSTHICTRRKKEMDINFESKIYKLTALIQGSQHNRSTHM